MPCLLLLLLESNVDETNIGEWSISHEVFKLGSTIVKLLLSSKSFCHLLIKRENDTIKG